MTIFKNGFLYTFRDHSTSWCEDGEARDWFFKSVEARFVRHYKFRACDNGPPEISLRLSGDYNELGEGCEFVLINWESSELIDLTDRKQIENYFMGYWKQ